MLLALVEARQASVGQIGQAREHWVTEHFISVFLGLFETNQACSCYCGLHVQHVQHVIHQMYG